MSTKSVKRPVINMKMALARICIDLSWSYAKIVVKYMPCMLSGKDDANRSLALSCRIASIKEDWLRPSCFSIVRLKFLFPKVVFRGGLMFLIYKNNTQGLLFVILSLLLLGCSPCRDCDIEMSMAGLSDEALGKIRQAKTELYSEFARQMQSGPILPCYDTLTVLIDGHYLFPLTISLRLSEEARSRGVKTERIVEEIVSKYSLSDHSFNPTIGISENEDGNIKIFGAFHYSNIVFLNTMLKKVSLLDGSSISVSADIDVFVDMISGSIIRDTVEIE